MSNDFYTSGWKILEKLESVQMRRPRPPGLVYSNRTHSLDSNPAVALNAPSIAPGSATATAKASAPFVTSQNPPPTAPASHRSGPLLGKVPNVTKVTKPVILGIVPNKASVGASVLVYGNHFGALSRVWFGSVTANTSLTRNARSIVCTVPAQSSLPTPAVDVRVQDADDSSFASETSVRFYYI
jgi:hypothetical protein